MLMSALSRVASIAGGGMQMPLGLEPVSRSTHWTSYSLDGTQPSFAIGVALLAIITGIVIGQGHWLYAGAICLIVLLVFRPVEVSLGLVVLLMPFESVTAIWGPENRSLLWFASALAACVLLGVGIVNRRLDRPPKAALWWILFICWGTASILWAYDPQVALQRLPTAWALLGMYVTAVSFRIRQQELQWTVLLTIVGGCAAALFSIYQFYQGQYWAGTSMRASMVVGETETNPNRFGVGLLIPMALAASSFLSARRSWTKLRNVCAVAIIGLALLLTMSRTAFLGAIVVAFVFGRRLAAKRRFIVVIALLAVLTFFMPAIFFTRIQQAAASGGSGRVDIWKVGVITLKKYAVFGAGLDNFRVVYQNYSGYAPRFMGFVRDPHNIYLGMAVEGGIIALLLFFLAANAQRKRIANTHQTRASTLLIACEATFWSMLVCGVFENILWSKVFWLSWILLTFALKAAKGVSDSHPAGPISDFLLRNTVLSESAQPQPPNHFILRG